MQGQLRLTGGRRLHSPRGMGTRPTTGRVREAIMNILAPRIERSHWLDLCCGSGVMGCEALQRGAINVVAIDRDSNATRICEKNLRLTNEGCSRSATFTVVRSDVLRWLKRDWFEQPFDLVYFDPPYKAGLHQSGLNGLSEGSWLHPDSVVICEYSSDDLFRPEGGWTELDRRRYGAVYSRT